MKKTIVLSMSLIILVSLAACNPTELAATAPVEPEEWLYVIFGDSISPFYPEMLRDKIEEDLNGAVTITINNRWVGGQTSSELLESIKTIERYREDIRDADLITFYIPFGGFPDAMMTYESGGVCGGEDNQDCLRDSLAIYKADTTAIFAEIVSLRSPSEAMIRVHDMYQFRTTQFQEGGTFDVFNHYWREANAHVHATAEKYDIPVANVYDAFMGEDGRQPPEENGLVESDMTHPTQQGNQLIADLLFELGYELSKP
jgi:hypothetical protein